MLSRNMLLSRGGTIIRICILASLLLVSCHKKRNEPTPAGLTPEEQARVDLLSHTWSFDSKASQVTLDGNDIGREFTSFALTIKSDFSYITTGGSSTFKVWPATGTWSFVKNSDQTSDITRISRSDGVEIKIEAITSTDIVLSFQYTGASIDMDATQSGKYMSITGQYVFSLNN